MIRHRLNLVLLDGCYAVVKLDRSSAIPSWATEGDHGDLISVTRTMDELSIVCPEANVPDECTAERGWRCFRVAGQIAFSAVGVLASLTKPLARAGIGLFAISTFDTDYLLVKGTELECALQALRRSGHSIRVDD